MNDSVLSTQNLQTRIKTFKDYLTYMELLHNDPTYGKRLIEDICNSENKDECFETLVPKIFENGVVISVKPIKNAAANGDYVLRIDKTYIPHETLKLKDDEDFTQLIEKLKTKKSRSVDYGKMSRTRKFLHNLNPWNWRKGGTKRRRLVRRTKRRVRARKH